MKQVWKQKMLWEGFIKCCERTKPQSFRVLLQLPPAQLKMLLDSAPDMREPLLEQVQGFTESQRQHVPASIMQVLYNVSPSADDNTDNNEDSKVDGSETATNDNGDETRPSGENTTNNEQLETST